MTTKITEQNVSNLANVGVDWQSVITGDTTMVAGRGYFVNTTSGVITMTLPASPSIGDTISIRDYAGTFGSNKLTVARNSSPIEGGTNNLEYATNNFVVTLVYIDGTRGWVTTESEAKAGSFPGLHTEATGGTVATSGDYKIHSFTGDGNFVVSQVGNGPSNPQGGPNTVSYLVIAGGGAGGSKKGGGGGAGGYREGRDITPSYTASPLVAPAGLTITAATFPVTVGAGGAGAPECSQAVVPGSNSVFSTITSTSGGGGGTPGSNAPRNSSKPNPSAGAGDDGGSGGGVSDQRTNSAYRGLGNTPPVSPSQGNTGGSGVDFPPSGGGGGGGASAVGANATSPGSPSPSNKGGNGGAGTPSSITGSGVARAGGGGGGINPGGSGEGDGGSGGGGAGRVDGPGAAPSGTANTGGGGGGGGAGNSNNAGGNGGKGIVIIRFKYQN